MKFSVFQVTRKGGRQLNEDRMGYSYTRSSGILLLADGMGGHPEGEVAAQLALQAISALYQKQANLHRMAVTCAWARSMSATEATCRLTWLMVWVPAPPSFNWAVRSGIMATLS